MKLLSIILLCTSSVFAQQTLRVNPGEIFQLTGKTFLLDSLVLGDSSQLLLDDNFDLTLIRCDYVTLGKGCAIIGIGKPGGQGLVGINSNSRAYSDGRPGTSGFAGISLIFNFRHLQLDGDFIINLTGGPGGDGGAGGTINRIPSTTNPAVGTTSRYSSGVIPQPNQTRDASFGEPGAGGAGGRGGNLTLSFPGEYTQLIKQHFIIINPGGIGGSAASMDVPIEGQQTGRPGAKGRKGKVVMIPQRR
ncbi:MAG: hypothetical protein U0289_00610 [Cyclobacteriaceae bacterium]|jgi:hypothetical protein|nr:hypothetical protein [Cyclobacteriaceae bacterium]HQQ83343.1 hypothetical protein [Cyclobacteriaceae bacterium]